MERMEEENVIFEQRKYPSLFRNIYWNIDRDQGKQYRRYHSGNRKKKPVTDVALINATSLSANPSDLAVYASVRKQIFVKWFNAFIHYSDWFDDTIADDSELQIVARLPKVVGIGLRVVFSLLNDAKGLDPKLCEKALLALFDVFQGHAPEELNKENDETIDNLFIVLVDISSSTNENDEGIAPLAASCLVALAVSRGLTENITSALKALVIVSIENGDDQIRAPKNLIALQRCVQHQLLGSPARNIWFSFGVPYPSTIQKFNVEFPNLETRVKCITSNGAYIYLFTSHGLFKVGTGFGDSVQRYTYFIMPDFFQDKEGWIGCTQDHLYVCVGVKNPHLYAVSDMDPDVLLPVVLEPPLEANKTKVFATNEGIGVIYKGEQDSIHVRYYEDSSLYNTSDTVKPYNEMPLQLSSRKTLILGFAPFEEPEKRRVLEPMDVPALNFQSNSIKDDEITHVAAGQEFALLRTTSGSVYFCGNPNALGYRVAIPSFGKWCHLKETVAKKEYFNSKKPKIVHIALGHEGTHAILVTADGSALFAGAAKRGEDGDMARRRAYKPGRPRKIMKVDSQKIVYAACNYGSTALVTCAGALLMFGKDTQHCERDGVVTLLSGENIVKVALGKAHAVALSSKGQVFTFGINNKGQCGREFGYAKEKHPHRSHKSQEYTTHKTFKMCDEKEHVFEYEMCTVCVLCHQCSGAGSDCGLANQPNRKPGYECGCGEGDGGCDVCGICKTCAAKFHSGSLKTDTVRGNDDGANCSGYQHLDDHLQEQEKDKNIKRNCLPPAKIAIPGGQKIKAIACGLHHTVLLSEQGDVFTFGSNQYGQLGAGDVSSHSRIIKVKVRNAAEIAAGSNHTVIMTTTGEVYTMGSHLKGTLGRSRLEGSQSFLWYAAPGLVHRLGAQHVCQASWIAASGDQTFIHMTQSLIKNEDLFESQITAGKDTILIFPRKKSHTHKCLVINRADGHCRSFYGPEQVDFSNCCVALDPVFDMLFNFRPEDRFVHAYNIKFYKPHDSQGCNFDSNSHDFDYGERKEISCCGPMKKLEDFKGLEAHSFSIDEIADSIPKDELLPPSLLDSYILIPSNPEISISRLHSAMNLFFTLDWLNFAKDNNLVVPECKKESPTASAAPNKEDFIAVNRFESHGGGWGYSAHSIEAIRFMCDTDILLGGLGLYGGRGEYTAKLKLFDIGCEGGEQEYEGELIAESEDLVFDCTPRDKCPVMFEQAVPIMANRWYVAWASINGPSSDCGSSGQAMVMNDDICFHFKSSRRSNNGTDVNAGQIPSLYYSTFIQELISSAQPRELFEPVSTLSSSFYRQVTAKSLDNLLEILESCWEYFKQSLDRSQQTDRLARMKTIKTLMRVVKMIQGIMRLLTSFINEMFPKIPRLKNIDYATFVSSLDDAKTLSLKILSEYTIPIVLKQQGRKLPALVEYFFQKIMKAAWSMFIECFHAFFITPMQKWEILCEILSHVKNGRVRKEKCNEVTVVCAALCSAVCLKEIIHYMAQNKCKMQLKIVSMVESSNVKDEAAVSTSTEAASSNDETAPSNEKAARRDSALGPCIEMSPSSNTEESNKQVSKSESAGSNEASTETARSSKDDNYDEVAPGANKISIKSTHSNRVDVSTKLGPSLDAAGSKKIIIAAHSSSTVAAGSQNVNIKTENFKLSCEASGSNVKSIKKAHNSKVDIGSESAGRTKTNINAAYTSKADASANVTSKNEAVNKGAVHTDAFTASKTNKSGLVPPPVPPRTRKRAVPPPEPRPIPPPPPPPPPPSMRDWGLEEILHRLIELSWNPAKKILLPVVGPVDPNDEDYFDTESSMAKESCNLISRLVGYLAQATANGKDDADKALSSILLTTPSRFGRVNQTKAWNTGNGSPDAIAFSVNRPGIAIVGVGVYTGNGTYNYELDLLQDFRDQLIPCSDMNAGAFCWYSTGITRGTFSAADSNEDNVVDIKFDRPIPIEMNHRYAIRLCNRGARTVCGDGGIPSTKGPDGTTFKFFTCSLSCNGTTSARGQIPCIIYTSVLPSSSDSQSDNCYTEISQSTLRSLTINTAAIVLDKYSDFFALLKNPPAGELVRDLTQLEKQPHFLSILLPGVLAHLDALTDSKSMVELLEMVRKILPHVVALNRTENKVVATDNQMTSGYSFDWVESDHPYKLATVTNIRVLFPPTVCWITIEFDPKSGTGQPEDILTVYARVKSRKNQHCHCARVAGREGSKMKTYMHMMPGTSAESSLMEESVPETYCLGYDSCWIAVTNKLSNIPGAWPKKAIVVPGNDLIFSLEAASDYINEYKGNWYGFRALVRGHDMDNLKPEIQGIGLVQMELAQLGASCAYKLMAPEEKEKPDQTATQLEALNLEMDVPDPQQEIDMVLNTCDNEDFNKQFHIDSSERFLLHRGLELNTPPTVHQIVNSSPFARTKSTERQFLDDFIQCDEKTAGGRLACWLQPDSRVECANCELKLPPGTYKVGVPVNFDLRLKDQYGEIVRSPELKVEIIIQLADPGTDGDGNSNAQRMQVDKSFRESGGVPIRDVHFDIHQKENLRFHAISMLKQYVRFSFEEIRWAALNSANCGVPPEKILVHSVPEGFYTAMWVPKMPGRYSIQCTLDDKPIPEVTAVVKLAEPIAQEAIAGATPSKEVKEAPKLVRITVAFSAGVRIRSHPSLQAEAIGVIPYGVLLEFVEETHNNDGGWVRLHTESSKQFLYPAGGSSASIVEVPESWIVAYHDHYCKHMCDVVKADDRGPNPSAPPAEEFVPDCWDTPPVTPMVEDENMKNDDSNDDLSDASDDDVEILDIAHPERAPAVLEKGRRPVNRELQNLKAIPWTLNGNKQWEDNEAAPIIAFYEHPASPQPDENNAKDDNAEPEDAPPKDIPIDRAPTDTGDGNREDHEMPEDPRLKVHRSNIDSPQASQNVSPPPFPLATEEMTQIKLAKSPLNAESLRAAFAAFIWHEGIVHDAMACAAFLKFHPDMPKTGMEVTTRGHKAGGANIDDDSLKPSTSQRHSVEVATGQYLNIQPSCLESLTRSALNANANRRNKRKSGAPAIEDIKEEDPAPKTAAEEPKSAVKVLPPALRAFVAFWEAFNEISYSPRCESVSENSQLDHPTLGNKDSPKMKRNKKQGEGEADIECELCGLTINLPVAPHFQKFHPGCGKQNVSRGYGRMGIYHDSAVGFCGESKRSAYFHWYVLCPACRNNYLRDADIPDGSRSGQHWTILENALFLLELAPAITTDQASVVFEDSDVLPPQSPSEWQPAPPVKYIDAIISNSKPSVNINTDELDGFIVSSGLSRKKSLDATGKSTKVIENSDVIDAIPSTSRVPRSISMGQTQDFPSTIGHNVQRKKTPVDDMNSDGAWLLVQPSSTLKKLVKLCTENNKPLTAVAEIKLTEDAITQRPVTAFVTSKRDLAIERKNLITAAHRAIINRYSIDALNWLLRSVSLPQCLHDVMWHFCAAMERHVSMSPVFNYSDQGNRDLANEPIIWTDGLRVAGKFARDVKLSLQAFLQTVSGLMPHLHDHSPLLLQAVRCWAIQCDHTFLHSRTDEARAESENNAQQLLPHQMDSTTMQQVKYTREFRNPDLTSCCEVQVSSRQAMIAALTDNSTETFWESGDDDRVRTKWLQITCNEAMGDGQIPDVFAVHVDNSRDTAAKVTTVAFTLTNLANDLQHSYDVTVDSAASAWAIYSLPYNTAIPFRIRCELRGPDAAVRVRQIKLLGINVMHLVMRCSAKSAHLREQDELMKEHIEVETLRVFRYITSQVFGRLLTYDRRERDADSDGENISDSEDDESEFREHVVGILFSRSRMTNLQKQVVAHVVTAIGMEAKTSRANWEHALNKYHSEENPDVSPTDAIAALRDEHNYCFEMLSLLLALSGSAVGRTHLAQRPELILDLLSLLHTGTERIQRQVIALLRRLIGEIKPQRMQVLISNFNSMSNQKVSFIEVLAIYICKAMTVQLKARDDSDPNAPRSVQAPMIKYEKKILGLKNPVYWFLRGTTARGLANNVVKLLTDMLESKFGPEWFHEAQACLLNNIVSLSSIDAELRKPVVFLEQPSLWITLCGLAVIEQSSADRIVNGTKLISGPKASEEEVATMASRPLCANHDDGHTVAVYNCATCGSLCMDCDRFLHLNKANRRHKRFVCKEEEQSIRINISESCGRLKLFWLLLLVDRRTFKVLVDFRNSAGLLTGNLSQQEELNGIKTKLTGVCRYCGCTDTRGILEMGNVCAEQECQDHSANSCPRILSCGHLCGGVRQEETHLPCLFGCAGDEAELRQDAEDMCMICFTDPLSAAPAIQLKCKHVYHYHCSKKALLNKWNGPRITFAFSQCPICKEDIEHWSLDELTQPIRKLFTEVKQKALMRLEFDGLEKSPAIAARYRNDASEYALDRYAYYECFKCRKAYFGGEARCDAEVNNGSYDPSELLCGGCSDVTGARVCHKHGTDFLEYKCRYCCSVAVFFCFGTSHFCNGCHDEFQRVTSLAKEELPSCPAGPKGVQLPGLPDVDCPLHIEHPPTGEEFALGCGVCRDSHTF